MQFDFSGTSGCLLSLDWLLSSFLCEEAKVFYLCLHVGWNSHLRLRLLLVGTYSLPFFHTCVPLSVTAFLPVLKADPLASLEDLDWWRYIL